MTAPGADRTVFVVEDDDSVRRSIRLLLKSAGYKVETYTTATEFLEGGGIAKRDCCLILDMTLPGMSGIEFLDLLTREGILIPTVCITGRSDDAMAAEAVAAGALACVRKPFRSKQLLALVERALEEERGEGAPADAP